MDINVMFIKVIAKRKEGYHNFVVSKLNNPKTSAKAYWPILKLFDISKKCQLFLHS